MGPVGPLTRMALSRRPRRRRDAGRIPSGIELASGGLIAGQREISANSTALRGLAEAYRLFQAAALSRSVSVSKVSLCLSLGAAMIWSAHLGDAELPT